MVDCLPRALKGTMLLVRSHHSIGAWVVIGAWASSNHVRGFGIFQRGSLGFWSWWVAQMSLVARGFPGSWQICRQLFRCSAGVFPCCCVHRMLVIICH